ncbi:MAG: DUF6476 family protein [Paracoccaceae bacterium]
MASDMNQAPNEGSAGTPPELRFLKLLVSVLAGTMILGLITIIALLVIRLPAAVTPPPTIPDGLALPDGAQAAAVTAGRGWVAIVTDGEEILIFDAKTGELRQRVAIKSGK